MRWTSPSRQFEAHWERVRVIGSLRYSSRIGASRAWGLVFVILEAVTSVCVIPVIVIGVTGALLQEDESALAVWPTCVDAGGSGRQRQPMVRVESGVLRTAVSRAKDGR